MGRHTARCWAVFQESRLPSRRVSVLTTSGSAIVVLVVPFRTCITILICEAGHVACYEGEEEEAEEEAEEGGHENNDGVSTPKSVIA